MASAAAPLRPDSPAYRSVQFSTDDFVHDTTGDDTYRSHAKKPVSFKSLTGLSVEEFDALCREWVYADAVGRASATLTRTKKTPRQRKMGAGRKCALDAPTRLLMALVWLTVSPTWEALASLFGLDESNARRGTRDVLGILEQVATFPLEKRKRGQHGRALGEVLEEHSVLEVHVDSREQRIRRTTGSAKQRRPSSGKKKTHTLKMQAAVSTDGRVQAVSSESVPGTTSDLNLLDQSGVVEQLEENEAAGLDKGYAGVEKRHPTRTFYVPLVMPPNGELTEEEKSYNRALASVRIVVEHLFGRMSDFGRSTRCSVTGGAAIAESSAWSPRWLIARSSAVWLQGRLMPENRHL